MEDFKDVMLSEPPARAAPSNVSKSTNNNTTGISNSRTLSNNNTTSGKNLSSGAGDTTGADFSAYKGILLCDRPVDRTQLGAGSYRPSGDMGGPIPFLPSGKAGMIEDRAVGLPPSLESRSRLEQQRTAVRMETKGGTASGALARHKRWLKAFAQNMKEITQDQHDAEAKREKVKQVIREREAQKRQDWFSKPRDEILKKALAPSSKNPTPTDDDGNENTNTRHVQYADDNVSETPSQQQNNNNFTISNTRQQPSKSKSTTKSKPKPVWAMTEDEELDAEFENARDLLDFASSLDYDSFAKDCEVREAMAILSQRVKEIAQEKELDLDYIRAHAEGDGDEDDEDAMTVVSVMVMDADGNEHKVHQRKPRRVVAGGSSVSRSQQQQETGDKKPEWDNNTKSGAAKMLRNAVSAEAFTLAEKLLSENPALRQVHSKYSLSRMLQTVALTGGATADPNKITSADIAEAVKNPFANTAENQGVPFAGRLKPPVVSNIAPEAATNAGNKAAMGTAAASISNNNNDDYTSGGTDQQPAVHRRILVDLRKRKDQTQNLPYLYRHPGI